MAKLLRMSQFIKGSSTPEPPRDHFLPRQAPAPVTGFPEQRLSLRFSIGAEARLLLVIGVVCGLLIYESEKKSAVANPKANETFQTTATHPPAQPAQILSKPTPIVPPVTARGEHPLVSRHSPDAVPRAASSALQYPPIRYEATRKKMFGGCTGQLELSSSMLVFRCRDQADLILPVAAIAKTDKDGIVLKSGEKYHFLIANHTRGQVAALFTSWLNPIQ